MGTYHTRCKRFFPEGFVRTHCRGVWRYAPASQRGFSLLEVLVSIALLSLLVFALTLIFTQGLKALHLGYDRMELTIAARTALDQMMRDIPTVVYQEGAVANFYPFLGIAQADTAGKLRGADSAGSEIYFVGQCPGAGKSEIVELGYWLDKPSGAKTGTLNRFYVVDNKPAIFELPAAAANFTTGTSDMLTENVTDFVVRYHYRISATAFLAKTEANPWPEAWNSTQNIYPMMDNTVFPPRIVFPENVDSEGNPKNPDGLPNAVEIQITVQDKKGRQSPQTFTAYIPLET